MFWIQNVLSGDHYCVCKGSWKYFSISRIDVTEEVIRVFITPEDGVRILLFKMSRGDVKPDYLMRKIFSFGLHQHLKIEVEGGMICLVGTSYEGEKRMNYTFNYPIGCPFSDIEGIVLKSNVSKPVEIETSDNANVKPL